MKSACRVSTLNRDCGGAIWPGDRDFLCHISVRVKPVDSLDFSALT